jgi:putative transposase
MSPQNKRAITSESLSPPLEDGTSKAKLGQLERLEDKGGSVSKSTSKKPNPLFSMQESLPIPKRMTLTDKLIFYAKHTQMQNLYGRLEADSILGGENLSPFWNGYTKAISDVLSAPIPTERLDLDSHLLSGSALKQDVNSWFSMNVTYLQSKNSSKISCPSSTVSLLGYTDYESTKSRSNKQFKTKPRNQTTKLTPNAVKKIRVYPSKELHQVWKSWLAGYRWVYNWTISELKLDPNQSAYSLQSKCRNTDKPDWLKCLPGHQLQEAVADAVDAFKQAKKNKGLAKFKSCRAFSQVIKFKAGNYKNGTWYSKSTKGLSFISPLPVPKDCPYGTQLVYQKGKWFGCFPEYREMDSSNNQKVIALDPGSRAFLTGYDGEIILEVGKKDIGRINRLCSHLDQLISKISKSPSKRQRFKLRQAAQRLRCKIQNLVGDLHRKVSRFLVDNYKVIFLPTFETSQMVLKQSRKIKSKTARNMLTWSHYKFASHLTQMASRHNSLVVRCNESYTSKTCPHCGHIHNRLGGSKKFKCPECGFTADRDANGARNIMIRALQATAFTITGDDVPSLSLLSYEEI